MGSAFHQLCPRYSGTLTPTAPTAIRLWDTFTLPFYFLQISKYSYICLQKGLIYSSTQSGPQDQKSVIFSHSVISLNQFLKNSINTAYNFLKFRNHVKIFLSENIMHNFLSAVCRKNLSIRTDRTDKTVNTLIRLLL